MITIILAILGCILIAIAIFIYYKGNGSTVASPEVEIELAKSKKEIEKLNSVLKNKELDSSAFSPSVAYSYQNMLGNNLPLIEITDLDLSDDNGKKSDKNTYVHQLRFYVFNVGKNSLKDVIV